MNPRFFKIAALAVTLSPSLLMAVPAEIARESFEGAVGAIGFTTSVPQFDEPTVPTSDFFSVVPNNGTKVSTTIANGDSANMFAAEDIDTVSPGPGNAPTQSVTFNPVNIAGKTSPSVRILLSAPGTGAGGTGVYDWSATAADIDFVRVEASVDGSPFNRLVQFSPTTNTLGQPLSLDVDGDGLGGGTALTHVFQEFDLPFSTGNSVQVRVVMHSNATSEYICVDNVRIFADTPVTNPPALGGVPGTPLNFVEGSGAQALAPAITVTDSDSANLTSATVTISAGLASGEDVLAATPSGAILAGDIVYTPGTGTLTITRSAPLATWQTVLRSVTYNNTNATSPSTATRNVTFNASDGTNGSNSPVRQVQVVDNIVTQNLPFTETFETDGRGTRYALDGRFTIGAAMFDRGQPGAGVTNQDGTFTIIAEDTLTDAQPVKAVAFQLNTAPFGNVTASVRLGALGGAIYDTGDFILVEASVNGGAFTTVGGFRSTGGASTNMAQDTNLDGIGDGTVLGTALQDFSFPMPAAATLGLRVRCQSNTSGERLIVDHIVVTGTAITYTINSVSGGETGTRSFTVTRNVSTGADTVNYSAGGGTATSGTDYAAASGTVNFADGQTTRPIDVTITPDNIVELDETFQVTLSAPSRGTVSGGPGVGTITNDDASVITLTGGSVTEGDSGTANITFNYTLSNQVDTAVTFNRSTANGTATLADNDYVQVSNVATSVTALATTGNFTVTVNGDNNPESNETFTAVLSTLAAGGRNVTFSGGGATLSSTGTINDDDPVIVAGTGSIGTGIGASGKISVAALLALATNPEGRPLSLVSVQAGPTAGGGTVTVADGWINYQPAPGFSGADSFTYTITDTFQTVNGTVNVVASNGIGQTVNIVGITPQGGGNALVALGIPGRTYQWQTSPNLTTWTNLGAPIVCPATGVISQTDPGPLPPTRFYRMVQP